MKLMNLEGHTGRVSIDELNELRTKLLTQIECEDWYDTSIDGDGFNIVFPNNGKVFILRCEHWGEE
jgi:hypothetical protein